MLIKVDRSLARVLAADDTPQCQSTLSVAQPDKDLNQDLPDLLAVLVHLAGEIVQVDVGKVDL